MVTSELNPEASVGIFQTKKRTRRKLKAEEMAKKYEESMYSRGEEFVKVSLKVSSLGNLVNGD